jgi:exodeoxyribonuclease VII small subunit
MSDRLSDDLVSWRTALERGTFEEASDALEAVVARLERGQLRLEEALTCYELGVKLAERCEADLSSAELRVSRLTATGAEEDPWDDEDAFAG